MTPENKNFSFGNVRFSEGVFIIRLAEDVELDIPVVKALMEYCIEKTGGERFCVLIDANRNAKASPETRAYVAKAGYNKKVIARAVLTNSLAMKMTTNFFIRFNKPEVETRMFTDESHAMAWLKKKQIAAGYRT
ncbi:MAG: hypothetical protein IT233_09605 [Bacteroidia bacterium]|nr:hypothetical protein [Bacteroidia bacterium]